MAYSKKCGIEYTFFVNPNLPVRFLIYVGQFYDKYLADNDIYRYGRRLHRLLKPNCICFYNGTEKQPEEKILRLSEAFGADDGDIEVRVRMLNVNYQKTAGKPLALAMLMNNMISIS